jgi:raffinose/stachyose/melibiose transport system permease protein
MPKKIGKLAVQLFFLLAGIANCIPIISIVMNGFKTMSELSRSFFSPPALLLFGNFSDVIEYTSFFMAFGNSVLVTTVSVSGIIIISALASYAIVRCPGPINNVLYKIFVLGMVMPFSTIMIPTMRLIGFSPLSGRGALIVMYWALGISLAVFILSGFIKSSVPAEIEEAAYIDGAGSFQIFLRIVLPLLKAPIITVVMLDTIWIWNDFLLPTLLLTGSANRTIPLSQFVLVGQYQQKWNLQFAAFTLSLIPLLILFFSCQKYIIKGVAAGSVKG